MRGVRRCSRATRLKQRGVIRVNLFPGRERRRMAADTLSSVRNAEVKVRVGRGSCHWWDVMNDGWLGGGGEGGGCRDSHPDPER